MARYFRRVITTTTTRLEIWAASNPSQKIAYLEQDGELDTVSSMGEPVVTVDVDFVELTAIELLILNGESVE